MNVKPSSTINDLSPFDCMLIAKTKQYKYSSSQFTSMPYHSFFPGSHDICHQAGGKKISQRFSRDLWSGPSKLLI